jgi:DNA gyrase subunit A
MRIVIELRRDVNPNVVLNNLYKQTAMQSYFGINMLALVEGEPRILNIKEILHYYLLHQQQVIRRRTEFDLRKAQNRAHILEGYRIAFENLDEVIKVIRESENPDQDLMSRFGLSESQTKAILDMQIRRISKLEVHKIEQEYQELMVKIADYKLILGDETRILEIVAEELREIKTTYTEGKQKEEGRNRNLRLTEILPDEGDILNEDLIPREEVIVSLTRSGYVKRLPVNTYRLQKRGGRGVIGMDTKDDDFVEHLISSNSHHFLLFFTNKGKVYRLKAYEIPGLSRTARGTPIINLINIDQGETIKAVIPVEQFDDQKYLVFVTRNGIIKRTSLDEYSNIRRVGINAINLREDDDLIAVRMTDGSQQIVMGTRNGMSIRFAEQDARTLGRTATGVKGITLAANDFVIDADVVSDVDDVLIVSAKGFGKRTPMSEYRLQNRGGRGVRTLNITEKSGDCVALKVVRSEEDLLIITASGTIIRVRMQEITSKGRYTMGVKLINIREDDEVGTVAIVEAADEIEIEDDSVDESVVPADPPETPSE